MVPQRQFQSHGSGRLAGCVLTEIELTTMLRTITGIPDRRRPKRRENLLGGLLRMMMRRWAVLLVLVILAFIGVACGSSPATSQDSAPPSEPERVEPTATPIASPTPTPEPTATPVPSPTPTSEPTATPEPSPQSEPQTADPTTTPEPSPQSDIEDINALSKLAFAFWDAYNAYDGDKTLGYLEENYRQLRGEEIRDNIGLMKLFGVKLELSEESPPHMISDGEWEMHMTMKEPLGTRRIRMAFRQVEGEWKIAFAEQVQ